MRFLAATCATALLALPACAFDLPAMFTDTSSWIARHPPIAGFEPDFSFNVVSEETETIWVGVYRRADQQRLLLALRPPGPEDGDAPFHELSRTIITADTGAYMTSLCQFADADLRRSDFLPDLVGVVDPESDRAYADSHRAYLPATAAWQVEPDGKIVEVTEPVVCNDRDFDQFNPFPAS